MSRFIPCSIKPHVGAETRTFRTPDLQQRLDTPEHHAEVLTALLTVICGWLREGAKRGSSHGFRGNFTNWVETVDGVLNYAGIKGFGDNFNVFADLDEGEDEDFLAALVGYFGEGVTFTREQVEQALRKADRDPGVDIVFTSEAQKVEFAKLEALRMTMPRDSKAASPTVLGLRAPLSGRKLVRMLNSQVDLPVERDGKPLVTLANVKVNGERCWRFAVDGEKRSTVTAQDDAPPPATSPDDVPPAGLFD